ncbi:DNA topoisomerase III [Mucinivorans hirudinis]|uniref:DNA topoisomerase n=1 Tax=Mucinivorans hirudinis TaxID=1433126 RepID=A0A060R7Q3_9BACT|nr:DNA topoisomerase III [Mucinivorans hirudinis]
MKVIIAEKPSVAREIARIVGANRFKDGYYEGGDYAVTWALGHLVGLALPEAYGLQGFSRDNLPILPPVFTLVPRQVKGEKGYRPDMGAAAQLKVLKRLLDSCEKIIVATDAGREGELIFRFIYEYLGCAKPFDRLWISSLTEKAIREGLANLKCGAEYDKLYYAARARSEADWLVGINATQALTVAAGGGIYSLGRVQTPTLCMVCARYLEHREFKPQRFYQASITIGRDSDMVRLQSAERWFDKAQADEHYNRIKSATEATIEKVERKESIQEPPLLYDLTTLQKEANSKHGFSADSTLSIAQKLYEAALLTYPRTGSRYISEDVFAEIPALIASLKTHMLYGNYAASLTSPTRRSVDDKGVTDHHAILVTGNKPKDLSEKEQIIYDMVACRMLEAFSGRCIKDVTTIQAECSGLFFTLKGSIVKELGWRAVAPAKEGDEDVVIPQWCEGMVLPLHGCSLADGLTKAKPLHTEATLLAAMEGAGKEAEDEEARQAMKDCGIGTPATRAAIIETLFKRGYMERDRKSLLPTAKALSIYEIVKDMRIADVQMTGQWEAALAKIESGELRDDTFRKSIEVYTAQITEELLACGVRKDENRLPCPRCGTGRMNFYPKVVKCDNSECELAVYRTKGDKQLTEAQLRELIANHETGVIKGFKSKAGKSFNAGLSFDNDFNTVFVFEQKKKRK